MGASPVRVVEGEHPGGQLLHADAAIRAGVILGKEQLLPPDHVHLGQPFPKGKGGLQGLCQPALDPRLNGKPVHHHVDGMLLILVQLG